MYLHRFVGNWSANEQTDYLQTALEHLRNEQRMHILRMGSPRADFQPGSVCKRSTGAWLGLTGKWMKVDFSQ
ncbi:unnamed protein product [Spodoptera exigua]|nr:unnamed protein product [Spodoptera exigua]